MPAAVRTMRRVSKKLLIFLLGVVFTGFYCEYVIYYVIIAQCSWPTLDGVETSPEILKALFIADTHLLGPRLGHWLDKWRREWQMRQGFQTIVTLHQPDVVFVLGDLLDEGEWSSDSQFNEYVDRFFRHFAVPKSVKMYVVPGNHDIGFHNRIRRGSPQRFNKYFNASSVKLVTLKDNHFVLLNSMAMEGDSCQLCTEARNRIDIISERLRCSQNPTAKCQSKVKRKMNFSKPILLQHFPLYRTSDAICTEPDAPPLPERNKLFRLKIDALSKEATGYLVSSIKPRAVFGGHTHHGCLVHHKYTEAEFWEYSVPSFSWRNRPDPKYLLVSITPDEYAVNKCGLPRESTIAVSAVVLLVTLSVYTITKRNIGRGL